MLKHGFVFTGKKTVGIKMTFFGFHPAGANHCTDWGQIWQGIAAKFVTSRPIFADFHLENPEDLKLL